MRYYSVMNTKRAKGMNDTKTIAKNWLDEVLERKANRSNKNEAFVVGLSGHLGAGKTSFVKCIAEHMGISDVVTSPTFVLMKIYTSNNFSFARLVHIDAYRLERREELEALRFEDVISDPNNLVMIEWPENVGLSIDDLDEVIECEIKDGNYTFSFKRYN